MLLLNLNLVSYNFLFISFTLITLIFHILLTISIPYFPALHPFSHSCLLLFCDPLCLSKVICKYGFGDIHRSLVGSQYSITENSDSVSFPESISSQWFILGPVRQRCKISINIYCEFTCPAQRLAFFILLLAICVLYSSCSFSHIL